MVVVLGEEHFFHWLMPHFVVRKFYPLAYATSDQICSNPEGPGRDTEGLRDGIIDSANYLIVKTDLLDC